MVERNERMNGGIAEHSLESDGAGARVHLDDVAVLGNVDLQHFAEPMAHCTHTDRTHGIHHRDGQTTFQRTTCGLDRDRLKKATQHLTVILMQRAPTVRELDGVSSKGSIKISMCTDVAGARRAERGDSKIGRVGRQ